MHETFIASVISNNGIIRARGTSSTKCGSQLFQRDLANRLEPLCWDARAIFGTNQLEFTAMPPGSPGTNSVVIGNQTEVGAVGQITDSGMIFSDYFSGCLFFLFRDDFGGVYGVHSYRSSGIYPDPMPHFNKIGAKLIYFFNTGGVFSAHGPDVFGSVLCNVNSTSITIDFLAIRGNGNVIAVGDHQVITGWRTAPAIASPTIGGQMPQWTPPATTASPKQKGLKQRVAKLLINYI